MMCRINSIKAGSGKIIVALCIFSINSIAFSDNLLLKRFGEALWNVCPDTHAIAESDTLKNPNAAIGQTLLFDSVRLVMKDSAISVLHIAQGSVTVELVTGELCIDKKGDPGISVEMAAKGCRIVLKGTVAVLKFSKNGDPSVAVLSGYVSMVKQDGVTQDVAAGSFASFSVRGNSFSTPKPLPPNALESLQEWTAPSTVKSSSSQATQNTIIAPPSPIAVAPQSTEQPVNKKAGSTPAQTSKSTAPQSGDTQPTQDSTSQKDTEKKETPSSGGIGGEASVSSVTIDNQQWTRMALAIDVPLWRFGICFDIELFLDPTGNVSDRGWQFDSPEHGLESMLRKIRYIRYNKPGDNIYLRLGGLEQVTLGYGIIMNNFTNMLNYPGSKLLGLQAALSDLGPAGFSLDLCIPDFKEFGYHGGIAAGRLGIRPFKSLPVPMIDKIKIAASGAVDINQFAQARKWRFAGDRRDMNNNGVWDLYYFQSKGYPAWLIDSLIAHGDCDTSKFTIDTTYRDSTDLMVLYGGDLSIPIIATDLVHLDLYGQAAITYNDENPDKLYKGWGIGAPGIALTAGPFWSRIEYRYSRDRFKFGFFDNYYYNERLQRNPVTTKERLLPDNAKMRGVFGMAGCSILNAITLQAGYQYMAPGSGSIGKKDQWLDANLSIEDALVQKIPKVRNASAFYHQSNIDHNYFKKSQDTYWGYRIGFSFVPSTFISAETRFGWQENEQHDLEPVKSVTIGTGISF